MDGNTQTKKLAANFANYANFLKTFAKIRVISGKRL